MHSVDNPPNTRLGVNNWLILNEDLSINDVRVKLYCIQGNPHAAKKFLESRVELDYYVSATNGPPELRFDPIAESSDEYPLQPAIFLNDVRIQNNWCLLFGHATTVEFLNLPDSNFLEFKGDRESVYLASAFMLLKNGELVRLEMDLSGFVPQPYSG